MRTLKAIVCCVAIGTLSFAAFGQETAPPRGPGAGGPAGREGGREGGPGRAGAALSPEKAKAAWELEASAVAKRLSLNESQIKAVVKAYTESRESHNAAAEKMRKDMAEKARESGEDAPRGMGGMAADAMKAMETLNTSEREKLSKSLGATLSAEQTTKAIASLGTFNRQWDTFVDAVAGFNLEAAKQQEALHAIEDFIVAQSKLRAGPDADREVLRAAMQENRLKLSDAMKKTLSEEQFKKFESLMQGGRGMGRQRPGDEEKKKDDKGG